MHPGLAAIPSPAVSPALARAPAAHPSLRPPPGTPQDMTESLRALGLEPSPVRKYSPAPHAPPASAAR